MIRPLLKTEAKSAAHAPLFETPRTGTETKIKRYPLSPWTPGHRMTFISATPDSVMTYDEPIRCPTPWTPEHWRNAIRPVAGISYDEPIRCANLDTGCR